MNLNGKCQTNFNDIRFTDNDETTELDYWLESVKDSGGTKLATVWVKVADDLGSDQDIYIYYGKAGDSSGSNPRATFIVWDDFDGGADGFGPRVVPEAASPATAVNFQS